jgi:hypothetical protein
MNEEIQAQFDRAKELAKEIWFDDNETEDADSRYYFNCGFVAGLNSKIELTEEEYEAIKAAITRFDLEVAAAMGRKDLVKSWGGYSKALRSFLKRINDN